MFLNVPKAYILMRTGLIKVQKKNGMKSYHSFTVKLGIRVRAGIGTPESKKLLERSM
jgi:hypothetical protein